MTLFKKAVKHEAKLRLAIAGPSGSGKTYSALAIGAGLSDKVALVDTEHGSAAKYADIFDFDVLEMSAPFHPDRFTEAIQSASQAGYEVVIIDSLSHAWNGTGGLLELVDQFAKRMKSSNTFAAWKDATPIQNRLIESIVSAPIHIIATMRSKQEYILESIERNGRTINVPKKVGMAPVQRDSMEYEFDVYLDMDIENNAIVQKSRCPALAGQLIAKPGKQLSDILKDWLQGAPVPEPTFFREGDKVSVSGNEGDREGFVVHVNGNDLIKVNIDGAEYTVKENRLSLIKDTEQTPLFDDELEKEGAYSE